MKLTTLSSFIFNKSYTFDNVLISSSVAFIDINEPLTFTNGIEYSNRVDILDTARATTISYNSLFLIPYSSALA